MTIADREIFEKEFAGLEKLRNLELAGYQQAYRDLQFRNGFIGRPQR